MNEIPLEEIGLHGTTILEITAGEGHEINAQQMEAALRTADYRKGDHVLLRTGWGNLQRAYEMGINYLKNSPSVHYAAAALLADKMEEMDSRVFMTDCALVNPPRVQGYNWFLGYSPIQPLPKPWPSSEARERLMDMGGSYAYAHTSKEPQQLRRTDPQDNRMRKVPGELRSNQRAAGQNDHSSVADQGRRRFLLSFRRRRVNLRVKLMDKLVIHHMRALLGRFRQANDVHG